MTFNENLMREYEMAWKQIEYEMSTLWKFILAPVASAGSIILVLSYLRELSKLPFFRELYVLIGIVVIVAMGLLGGGGLLRFTTLAHVHRLRMLQIEAYLGLRAAWIEHLATGALERDIDKLGIAVDRQTVENEIRITTGSCPMLLEIVGKKYDEARNMIGLKIPYARYLVYAAFVLLLACALILFVYSVWILWTGTVP